jgi:single-stranded-DNA-specific exonuclease
LGVAQLDGARSLNTTDVAFRLAPRLNAAGRMDVARDVIELLTTKDKGQARAIAERLNQLNAERQAEEARIVEEICRTLDDSPEQRRAYCIVVDGEGWHRGVIGIAATRVVERYCRPALVISRLGEEAHGSGRSIPAFHLLNALESCQELFTRYGGHAHAVGFALPAERVPQLRAAMDGYARTQLTPSDFEPILNLDGELGLSQVTPELFQALCRLQPFGLGNPEPKFLSRGVRVLSPPRVLKDKHIKMKLAVEQDSRKFATGIPALGWGMAERFHQEQVLAGDVLDVAFTLEHNEHPEFGGLELRLCDVVRTGGVRSVAEAVGSSGPA